MKRFFSWVLEMIYESQEMYSEIPEGKKID